MVRNTTQTTSVSVSYSVAPLFYMWSQMNAGGTALNALKGFYNEYKLTACKVRFMLDSWRLSNATDANIKTSWGLRGISKTTGAGTTYVASSGTDVVVSTGGRRLVYGWVA